MQKKITPEMLDALKLEVATLENSNSNEIQVFEKSLQELTGLLATENLDRSPDLDSIEIITLERTPSLSSSIRQIAI